MFAAPTYKWFYYSAATFKRHKNMLLSKGTKKQGKGDTVTVSEPTFESVCSTASVPLVN